MMKNKWMFMLACAFIVISAMTGIAFRNFAFKEALFSNCITVKDLEKCKIKIEYTYDAGNWEQADFDAFVEEQLEGAKDVSNILVVKPTGNIYFNNDIVLEEVNVKTVIKGKCKYNTIWINDGLLNSIRYENEQVVVTGYDRSFMQEDCEYLVFLDELDTNKYSERKVYSETEAMWNGCYNITRDCVETSGKKMVTYNPDIEYYNNSKELLECYMKAKHSLMEAYMK